MLCSSRLPFRFALTRLAAMKNPTMMACTPRRPAAPAPRSVQRSSEDVRAPLSVSVVLCPLRCVDLAAALLLGASVTTAPARARMRVAGDAATFTTPFSLARCADDALDIPRGFAGTSLGR